jgi:hypothetical protein
MTRYVKKPIIVDAFPLPRPGHPDENQAFHNWCLSVGFREWSWVGDGYAASINVPTLEGVMRADPGHWIIKGVKGEFYPCKPDIFVATYDPVEEPSA